VQGATGPEGPVGKEGKTGATGATGPPGAGFLILSTGGAKANSSEFIGAADVAKTEAEVAPPLMPRSATITSMYCKVSKEPGAGKEDKFVAIVNGTEQAAATCTILGTATSSSTTGISGVSFTEGQTISVKTVALQGAPLAVISFGLG
jgi:hypothetical protein